MAIQWQEPCACLGRVCGQLGPDMDHQALWVFLPFRSPLTAEGEMLQYNEASGFRISRKHRDPVARACCAKSSVFCRVHAAKPGRGARYWVVFKSGRRARIKMAAIQIGARGAHKNGSIKSGRAYKWLQFKSGRGARIKMAGIQIGVGVHKKWLQFKSGRGAHIKMAAIQIGARI